MTVKFSNDSRLHRELAVKNFEEWGKPLNLEQYLEREEFLLASEFSSSSHELWVYEIDGQIVSACESYKSRSFANIEGELISGDCYRIGSVFTPSEFRKKGYASQMMKGLHKALMDRQDSIASVLYSDVGPKFYDKCGWPVIESKSLMMSGKIEREGIAKLTNLEDLRPLIESELHLMKQELDQNSFVIIPTYENTEWFHTRSQFYAKLNSKTVDYCGAVNGNGDWISWWHDFNEKKLVILNLRANSQSSIESLLSSAMVETENWGFNSLEIWDPSSTVQKVAPIIANSIQIIDREESLSCLAFWGTGRELKPVKWIHNEKYAWC